MVRPGRSALCALRATEVPLFIADVDLLAHVAPCLAIRGEKDLTDLAGPAEGGLALAGGKQEPLPDLQLLTGLPGILCL